MGGPGGVTDRRGMKTYPWGLISRFFGPIGAQFRPIFYDDQQKTYKKNKKKIYIYVYIYIYILIYIKV